MIQASVSKIKNSLSGYLEKVKAGQSVLITDHRKVVAVLEPVESAGWPEEIRNALQQGEGKAPRSRLDVAAFKRLPPAHGPSLSAAVLEERRQGR
ncbi:MAG: type II toxin-antitoxin system prevent-host-death family antitoxin [Verrucomicrobia bacterium]|nr:type II toxin-antitoxin system prevent-host-death family antitoxin [Verrucomicrobiota bacterium]